MPLFVKVRSFLQNLFLSRRVEADLDNEVRSHLELMTADVDPMIALRYE
jgi:hypothetical protein